MVRGFINHGLETGGANFLRVCFDLRNDVDVVVWKAFPEARPWAHDGLSLMMYTDSPEGTKAMLYFPSWYLLVALFALAIYGVGGAIGRAPAKRPTERPAGNGAVTSLSDGERPSRAPCPRLRLSRMKCCSVLLWALTVMGLGCSHTRSNSRSATVVIERPENNGAVNILTCTLAFSSGQANTLRGGETARVLVPAGPIWVEASSVDLYHPENVDPKAWRSRRVKICLQPGGLARLSVEPSSRDSTYVGGWTIERAANERSGVDAGRASLFEFLCFSPGATPHEHWASQQ
jgi:hypothetical protein